MIRTTAFLLLLLTAASPAGGSSLDARDRAALGIADPPVESQAGAWNWTYGPYRYDGTGNIAAIGTQAFVYDTRGRLVSATVERSDQTGTLTQTYEYDPYGNMTRRTLAGTATVMTTDAATNRLTAFGTVYDDAGNITQWQAPTTSHVYAATYDALRMIQELAVTDVADAGNDRFLYTAGDERIATLSLTGDPSHWTLRGLDGKVLRDVVVDDDVWSLSRDYIYRDGMLMAAVTPTRTLYFSLDHLGSPRVITDDAGVRVGFHHYLPFGEEWTDDTGAQEGEPMKFTGHERDRDLVGSTDGLDYMHARYYSAGLGRFLSVDPKLNLKRALRQPQNWNRYSYVMNNPLKYTDPTGEDVSIRVRFQGDGWTDEEKKKILTQVTAWYQKQNVGKVYVFDGATASHGGNFLTRLFNAGGYANINVSTGTGSKHNASTVFAGNYSGLSGAQRINAISNSIIHETAAHQFRATLGQQWDYAWYARDHAYGYYTAINSRYGTVADSWAYGDPKTRGNVTGGPIPIHPEDRKTLQQTLGPIDVEPPDDDQ